jgi:hypothetical protein
MLMGGATGIDGDAAVLTVSYLLCRTHCVVLTHPRWMGPQALTMTRPKDQAFGLVTGGAALALRLASGVFVLGWKVCPLVHLSTCPLVHLSTCPLVHLSTCPLVHLSTCPLVHLSLAAPPLPSPSASHPASLCSAGRCV